MSRLMIRLIVMTLVIACLAAWPAPAQLPAAAQPMVDPVAVFYGEFPAYAASREYYGLIH